MVKAKDGRPLKLEGNPSHPISEGALCASGQASIFDLYDADRAKEPQQVVNGVAKSSDWFVLDKDVKENYKQTKERRSLLRNLFLRLRPKNLYLNFYVRLVVENT